MQVVFDVMCRHTSCPGFFQLCSNDHDRCVEWAGRGECDINPDYMHISCAGSCGTCNKTAEAPRWNGQPWRLFEALGDNTVVDSAAPLIQGGMFLVFEGGQFIWPGVRLGFRRTINLPGPSRGSGGFFGGGSNIKNVVLETKSLQPLVLEVSGVPHLLWAAPLWLITGESLLTFENTIKVANFLSDDECGHVIGEASPNMAASKVALMDKDKGKADVEFRTSTTYFLPSRTAKLKEIDDRVEALTRVPRQHQVKFGSVIPGGHVASEPCPPLFALGGGCARRSTCKCFATSTINTTVVTMIIGILTSTRLKNGFT